MDDDNSNPYFSDKMADFLMLTFRSSNKSILNDDESNE